MMNEAIFALSAALAIGIAILGPAIAQGLASARAVEAIARQPEASGDIRNLLVLALAFMEALCIFGLLVAFMLLGKIS